MRKIQTGKFIQESNESPKEKSLKFKKPGKRFLLFSAAFQMRIHFTGYQLPSELNQLPLCKIIIMFLSICLDETTTL